MFRLFLWILIIAAFVAIISLLIVKPLRKASEKATKTINRQFDSPTYNTGTTFVAASSDDSSSSGSSSSGGGSHSSSSGSSGGMD